MLDFYKFCIASSCLPSSNFTLTPVSHIHSYSHINMVNFLQCWMAPEPTHPSDISKGQIWYSGAESLSVLTCQFFWI